MGPDWGGCLEAGAEGLEVRETDAVVLFGKVYEEANRDDPFGNELLAAYEVEFVLYAE